MPGPEHPADSDPHHVSRYESHPLAIEAASKTKPLPKDEKNPLADNASQDDLVLWMAYKDSKALIKLEPAPAVPAQPNGR